MRNRFEEQLGLLNRELLKMGALIELSIKNATQALLKQDVDAARAAIRFDNEIDQMERDIEALCLKLLLQQQPVAGDLRLISAAMKMITDMERIGDQAADISEIVVHLSGAPYIKKLEHLPLMADTAANMVTGSLDAFVAKDLELVCKIIAMDDIIDDLFDIIKNELIELIRRDAACGTQAMDLLMIAKYFERIGDHAQNIAEWVEYSITGRHKGEYLS
ncbi:MAG TPA: phosphate signaling complex protein PhoU [Thermoclostridium caenicola]|nr:phosphate signaling complex protein PhoU [Thermoclostridium caenicola]HOK42755.1 phosphate signaling complex protein PhoU [Thermoclostridium caenicola]HOL83991.1 phosphate signaling complex protein PhoU [Thermoclostridium caenicola]HOP71998.1 phosphate signaling complex protein PhoU [Thermoclostridium caenicola]HPO76020.1 phosphate signaling complex protein PhoU [Thermoclostridium caenicola]